MKNVSRLWAVLLVIVSGQAAAAGRQLTLDESRRLALQNNVRTRDSRLETEAARQARRAAFTMYFPAISAAGTALEADRPLMEIVTAGGNLPVYDGNPAHLAAASQFAYLPGSTMGLLGSLKTGMVSAVQPLFAGGRIMNGNRLAALGVTVSQDKALIARNEVLLATEEQYWRIVSLNEKLRTVRAYEDLLRRLLAQVEDAYGAGLVTKNDVLKVRLRLTEVMMNRSKAENGRSLAVMAFCHQVGIAHDPDLELVDPLIADGSPGPYHVDHEAVLPERPEYRLLRAAVRAEELKTRLKRGEYLPQAGLGVAGLAMKMDDLKGRTNGLVFGTLSIPVSGWWEASHALSERKAREEIARNALQDGTELLLLQMEKAWRDLVDADKQLSLGREAEAQAEENLRVNQDSYENGLGVVSDLLEAQALRQAARDQLTDGLAEYRLRLVSYLQVTAR